MPHIRVFTILLLFLATLTQRGVANPIDSIIVSGRIINIPSDGSRTLIINECDISDKSERRIAELDSSCRFCEQIPFSFGHTFTINYNRRLFINAYAMPGDSIFVEIDASKKPVEFHLSGDNSTLNESYSHAFEALSHLYYDINLKPDTVPLAEFMPVFKAEVAKTRATVDDYIRKNSIAEDVAEMLYVDNLFLIANQAIGFKGKNREEQFAFFTDPIFDILNEGNVRQMIFPYHLSALVSRFPEYIEKTKKCMTRDIMYVLNSPVKPDRSEFKNTAYYDRIYGTHDVELNTEAIKSGDFIVFYGDSITSVENENPLEYLKREFQARPVYLDVCATWCGPCRASLSGSEGIREYFKNSDICFAILWLRSDLNTWAKLVPTIHNAVHIFVQDEDLSNRIMGHLNISGFPSTFFIDRRGTITDDDVPGYMDFGLSDFLKSKQHQE